MPVRNILSINKLLKYMYINKNCHTLSEFLSECFPKRNSFIVDLGEVGLADPGGGVRVPVGFISATGLYPLTAQLWIVQGERKEG